MIVHYIPGFFFCQTDLLKGWFSHLKSGKSMLNFKKFEYRLPDSPWRLSDSPSRGVSDSPISRVGESSFFYYEYLREFEAKIETARNVV